MGFKNAVVEIASLSDTLPAGWRSVPLGEITRTRSGNSKLIKGRLPKSGGPGLFPGFSASGQDVWVPKAEHHGDAVIVSAVGARCGKCFLASGSWSAIANTHIVWPDERFIDTRYLWWRINDERFWVKGGSAQPFVKVSETFKAPFSLPPLSEQRRIVARIEDLFERIRYVRLQLVSVRRLLRRYQQRVLANVFEDACANEAAYPLGTFIAGIEAGKNLRCEERPPAGGERGIVKISAVTWGRFDASQVKTPPHGAQLDPRSRIKDGDFLISRANTVELVGAPVIARGVAPETYLSDKVLRIRFTESIDDWVLWFFRSSRGRAEIESRSSGNQLSMRNITQTALRNIPIPMPSEQTRHSLVAMIESKRSIGENLQSELARAEALLPRLESTLLNKAIAGDLVPPSAAGDELR